MRTGKKQPAREHEMDMTPMIDVTFLLLIFFMCTLQFKTLEGKLQAYLPNEGPNSDPTAVQVENVHVLVQASVDPSAARVLNYRVGPQSLASLTDLQTRLARLHAADAERPLAIETAGPVTYEEVVQVVDHVLFAGYRDVRFIGVKD